MNETEHATVGDARGELVLLPAVTRHEQSQVRKLDGERIDDGFDGTRESVGVDECDRGIALQHLFGQRLGIRDHADIDSAARQFLERTRERIVECQRHETSCRGRAPATQILGHRGFLA